MRGTMARSDGVNPGRSTFVESLLYGLEPRDPLTLAGAIATLSVIGLLAGWLPAHRAARIDPMDVLRDA